MQDYATLTTTFARLGALEDASGILGWDTQTQMPDGAADTRGEQLAVLSVLAHEILTDPSSELNNSRARPAPRPLVNSLRSFAILAALALRSVNRCTAACRSIDHS